MPVLYKRCVCRTCISYFISNLDVEETLVRTCVRLSASHITFSSHSVVTGDLNPWPLVPFLKFPLLIHIALLSRKVLGGC